MRDSLKLLGALSAIVLAVACGAANSQLSTAKHDVDAPTRGAEPWMWANVTDVEYRTHVTPLVGVEPDAILPQDHALTKRLQTWVDRIDGMLRAEHPEALALTPKPRAKVVKEASINAFVAPVPVCYDLPVKIRSGSANAGNTTEAVYLDAKNGELSAWPEELRCIDGTDATATVKRFVEDFNASSTGICTLSINNGKLTPSSGCSRHADLGNAVAAKSVVLMQTANHITVFTGLVASMGEAEFVAVVAHELGHYYRSHANTAEADYDFFYNIPEDGNHAHRPTADESLRQLGQAAIAGSTVLSATDLYRTLAGQTLRPETFFTAGSIVKSVCAVGSCPTECAAAAEYIDGEDFAEAMGRYPFGRGSNGEANAYKAFETKTLACLEKIQIKNGATTANSIAWTGVQALTMQPVWPAWLAELPAGTQGMMSRYLALAALRAGETTTATDAAAALKAAAADMKAQDDESEGVLKEAYAQRLGYYTFEQEADDEAAEWLADLGLDPMYAVKAMQALGKGDTNGLRGMLVGENDCDTMLQNDWLGANGSAVFVPVGDYSEIHHSACFRMYNIAREIDAHEYVVAGTAPSHGGSSWTGLQNQAAGMSGDHESLAAPVRVHALVKKTGFARCSYAQSKYL